MDDGAPVLPPTSHFLRPHHVGLLAIFILIFRDFEPRGLPDPFILHVYRLLLNEVAQPKPYSELLVELSLGAKAGEEEPQNFITTLKAMPSNISTAEQMTNFFGGLPILFVEKSDDDEPPILMSRSIFGYFCRRCFVSFLKLSFSGVVKLQKDYQAWCAGDLQAGYGRIENHQLNGDMLLFKTQADKNTWAQPEPYEAWEIGQATGDENIATENLRRYFEQHFHESNDSGVRQHALLNLVRMHYGRQEYVAARKLLSEAITVARTSNDRITLQHCISLSHRLPPTEPGHKPILNELQPDLNPLEILYDIKKLTDVKNEQPLSAAFERIVQVIGLYDHWIDVQSTPPDGAEEWAQHAVQSILWAEAGCNQLAAVEENTVIAFTDVGGDDNNRLTVILNRAYRWARQGKYEEGLAILLEHTTWCGITLNDYAIWASQVWHILVLRASRRGQERLYRELLLPRRPKGNFEPREYFLNTGIDLSSFIRNSLYEVIQMRSCNQTATVIEQLLTALWHSEFQGRLHLYRIGIILLADVSLEFGMTKRCQRILDEIMPQVINGDDLETRALACFSLARCIIAADGSSAEALKRAIPYLLTAEQDYKDLQILRSVLDVQYLLSVVYHNLGMERERDEFAERILNTEIKQKDLQAMAVDEQITEVLDVVTRVGSALASR